MIKDITWMLWAITIGLIEAFIQLFNKSFYIVIDEDKCKIKSIKWE